MQTADYIGFNKGIGDLTSSGVATATSGARVLATGGADISADIALLASSVSFASSLWEQWTSHPAADARDFISKIKPQIVNVDPHTRLTYIIAADTKINHRAKDVSASELVKWYRYAYSNDYKTLSIEDKNYFNNYLINAANQAQDVNQASRDYKAAMFTPLEVNYNATPIQTVSNLFTSATTGKTNWVLYGAIGIGIILLIKNISK